MRSHKTSLPCLLVWHTLAGVWAGGAGPGRYFLPSNSFSVHCVWITLLPFVIICCVLCQSFSCDSSLIFLESSFNFKKFAKHVTSGGVTFEESSRIFFPHITHNVSGLSLCCVVPIIIWPYFIIVFLCCDTSSLQINCFYTSLLSNFSCYASFFVSLFFFTCLLVPCGVCVTPISPDRQFFWQFCWFCPPSHLRIGHFVVAHHTFLCALLLRIMEILLWVRYAVCDQTYIDICHG